MPGGRHGLEAAEVGRSTGGVRDRSVVAYVLPFALYLGLTQLPSLFPDAYYPPVYSAVVVVVGLVTGYFLWSRPLLRPHRRVGLAVAVGLVGIALWIGLCQLDFAALLPTWLRPGNRRAYNPFEALDNPVAAWAFVAVRLVGMALLVPVVEELFWRGFLARWLLDADWQARPVGQFTLQSFLIVTLLFTLAHPEWLAAAVYGVLLNAYLAWKKDLWGCVVAHGVSNLVLGVYILAAEDWKLW
jgi:CAAX prenyl protease-like protein